MSEFNVNVGTFLEQAGSASPTPGGGSVAALAAALGASMGSMVARLTAGPKYAAAEQRMQGIAEQMTEAIRRCETLSGEDIAAFNRFMSALALPKSTEAEKQARSGAIGEAAKVAAEVPLALLELCLKVLAMLREDVHAVNRNAVSDWGIGALLAEAAAQSAWLTAQINLPFLTDTAAANEFRERGERLISECALLKEVVVAAVKQRL